MTGGSFEEARVAAWRAELAVATERFRKAALHYEIGHTVEHDLGDVKAAAEHYRAAASTDPEFRPPLFALIRMLERSNDTAALAELYAVETRVAKTTSDGASAIVDQACLLEDRQRRDTQAKVLLERVCTASAAAALMLELHLFRTFDATAAMKVVQSRSERVNEPVLKRLLALEVALGREQAGDVEGSLGFLRTASAVPVERWRTLRHLERLLRRHGRIQELVDVLEQLATLAEAHGRGEAVGLGLSAGSLPTFADEESARDQAAVLLWDAAHQRRRLGGDPAGALDAVTRALTIRPNELVYRLDRMELLAEAGDPVSAIREARSVLSRCGEGPHTAAIQVRLAALARAAGNAAAERAALEAAVQADPGSVAAAALMAEHLSGGTGDDRRLVWLEARAAESEGEARTLRLWEAGDVAARSGADFVRVRRLLLAAAEEAGDPTAILRELWGAAQRLDPDEAARVADRLLELPLDDEERGLMLYVRYRSDADRAGGRPAADEILRGAIARGAPPSWVPHVARLRAGTSNDHAMLAAAHRALAAAAGDTQSAATHLCAAGRALGRGGDLEQAVAILREALLRVPGHGYALALLEELLRRSNQLAEVAELLLGAAAHEDSDRLIEPLLLRAGAAADAAGSIDLAAQAYREGDARCPKSIAPAWCLYRMGVSHGHLEIELEALQMLASRESKAGRPSRASLLLGEHLDLVVGDGARGCAVLRPVMADEFVGLAAAAHIVLAPRGEAHWVEALERLIRDAYGQATLGFRRALGGLLLGTPEKHEQVTALAARVLEARPDDRWALYAAVRASGLGPGSLGRRADALEALGAATIDAGASAELLLLARWTRALAAPPGEAIAGALGEPETIAGGVDAAAAPSVEALAARVEVAPEAARPALLAALGRALLNVGRPAEAVDALRSALARQQHDLASWEALLVAARQSGSWDDVVRACDRLAQSSEGTVRAMLLETAAVVLLDELGHQRPAEERMRAALAQDPSRRLAYSRLHDLLEARDDTAGLLGLVTQRIEVTDEPEPLVELLYEQAVLRRSLGQNEGAVESLETLQVVEPAHAHGLALMAEMLVGLGRWPEAVDALRSLACVDVSANARRVARWAAARYVWERMGDPSGALQELDVVERMGFTDEALLVLMAHLAEQASSFDRAVDALTRAAALVSGERRARYERRAGTILATVLANPEGAVQAYRRALDAAPTDLATAEALVALLDGPSRRRVARTFEAAVLKEAHQDPTRAEVLVKLVRCATWAEDRDLELIALSVLEALGTANAAHVARREELAGIMPALPSGSLNDAGLAMLGVPPATPLRDVAQLASEALGAVTGQDAKSLGVGRREILRTEDPSGPRDELEAIIGSFGTALDRVYVGGPDAAGVEVIPTEGGSPSWVLGAGLRVPLPTEVRFHIGQLALGARAGMTALIAVSAEEAETLLLAALAAADHAVPGTDRPEVAPLAAQLRKAMSRGARKAIAAVGAAAVREDVGELCRSMRGACLRTGMLVTGDLYVPLSAVCGRAPTASAVLASEEALGLVRFWLSEDFRTLRCDLGLDHAAASHTTSDSHPVAGADGGLERASGFFGLVAAPPEWDVSVEDLAQQLGPLPRAGRERVAEEDPLDRASLLDQLARAAAGPVRARLLSSAAEVLESSGQGERARALHVAAREADPKDVSALRHARAEAARRRAWPEVVALLEQEAEIGSVPAERGQALTLASLITLHHASDLAAAEVMATRALSLRPDSAVAAFHLALIQLAAGNAEQGNATLERAAREWKDDGVEAALLIDVARGIERSGDLTRARFLFKRAMSLDPDAIDAAIGLARTARAQRSFDEALDAIARIASTIQARKLKEAFMRAAARIAHLAASKPTQALTVLGDASEFVAVEAMAEAARAAGDPRALGHALTAVAAATRRTDRALALVQLAELRASTGDLPGAREALREAGHADQKLAWTRTVGESIARRAGDVLGVARVLLASGHGSLAASARAAFDTSALEVERRFAADALSDETHDPCATSLSLDLAALSGDAEEIRRALRQCIDQAPPESRLGPMTSLADVERDAGNATEAMRLSTELRRLFPSDALARYRLALLWRESAPAHLVGLWEEEGNHCHGDRSAFAHTMAAKEKERTGADPLSSYRAALEAESGYQPALWGLEALARRTGAVDVLEELLVGRAEHAATGREMAERLVRAAFAVPEPDPAILRRAQELAPDDAVLLDLRLRLSLLPPAEQALLLLDAALLSPPSWARVQRLRASVALERAGQPAEAAAACRSAEDEADVIVSHLLDHLEPAANELDAAERRLRADVTRATDDTGRALALDRLAGFALNVRGDAGRAVEPLKGILAHYPDHVSSLRALERHHMENGDDEALADIEERFATLGHPQDALAHARLATRLRLRAPDATPDAADGLLVAAFEYCQGDLWLARKVEAVARYSGDQKLLSRALTEMVEMFESPAERAAVELRLSEVTSAVRAPSVAANRLSRVEPSAPDYPVIREAMARLRELGGAAQRAAEAYESAASSAKSPRLVASLSYRAGRVWEEQVHDLSNAARAYMDAAAADPTYEDILARIAALPPAHRDDRRLADLVQERIGKGGRKEEMVEQHVLLARLRHATGDAKEAKKSLRTAAVLAPERLDLLEQLFRLCEADNDLRGAADALQKTTQQTTDPRLLRNVYTRLSEIYHQMRDIRRARWALEQVLAIDPTDTVATQRLAALDEGGRR